MPETNADPIDATTFDWRKLRASRPGSPNSFIDEAERLAVGGDGEEDRSGERLFDYYDQKLGARPDSVWTA